MKSNICMNCADKSCYGYDRRVTECEDFQPMTHFDEIKDMSVDDLAAWISHITGCPLNNFLEHSPIGKCVKKCKAKDCWVAWLKAPADKEETG